MKLTKAQADEIRYRLDVVASEPDLLDDYGLTEAQVEAVHASVPDRGEWQVPAYAVAMIRDEVECIADQLTAIADFDSQGFYLTQAEEDRRRADVAKLRRQARGFSRLAE